MYFRLFYSLSQNEWNIPEAAELTGVERTVVLTLVDEAVAAPVCPVSAVPVVLGLAAVVLCDSVDVVVLLPPVDDR